MAPANEDPKDDAGQGRNAMVRGVEMQTKVTVREYLL